jgi:hypothetical protein
LNRDRPQCVKAFEKEFAGRTLVEQLLPQGFANPVGSVEPS